MLKTKLQDGIVVRTREGDFKLLRDNKLEDLPSDELMLPQDDLAVRDKRFFDAVRQLGARPTSSFYFNVDDEHEIRKLTTSEDEDRNKAIKEFIESTVANIFVKLGLQEGTLQNLQLRNIIISRLKDVRSLAETKEALIRLHDLGGMSLSEERLDELLRLIEKERIEVEKAIKTGRVSEIELKNQLTKPKTISRISELVKEKEEPKKTVTRLREDLEGVRYHKRPEVVGGDEVTRHIVTGPVEEIKNMTLKDFRRLGSTPTEAADRVLQKIDLLGDESLIKRAEGVKAWYGSEINRLYLTIGAKSMAEKKPVEEVIRDYRAVNKPYLAPEEFNAVADLNRKLSY